MSPLTEHLDRVGSAGAGLLEFELTGDTDGVVHGIDVESTTGFAIAATDAHDHVMIVEVSISADGRGLTAVVSTYDGTGQRAVASLADLGHQVMVTVD